MQDTDNIIDDLQGMLRDRGGTEAAYDLFDQVTAGECGDEISIAQVEEVIHSAELLQALLEQRQATEAAAESDKAPRPGSMEWYRVNRNEPILEGSQFTIFQAAYCLLRIKANDHWTDNGLATLIRMICGTGQGPGLLPQQNNMPRCARCGASAIERCAASAIAQPCRSAMRQLGKRFSNSINLL